MAREFKSLNRVAKTAVALVLLGLLGLASSEIGSSYEHFYSIMLLTGTVLTPIGLALNDKRND